MPFKYYNVENWISVPRKMLKFGLLWRAEPKYSKLRKDENQNEDKHVSKFEAFEIIELDAFDVSDSKDVIKEPSGDYSHFRRVAIAISWFSVIFGFSTGIAGISLGQIFGNEALFGYGLDALLDSMSSVAVLWRFYSNCSAHVAESKERRACIVISLFFFASSISLIYKSLRGFKRGNVVEEVDLTERLTSDIFSSVCALVALCAGIVKVYYGRKLQSRSLLTDSIITFVGAFMSFMTVLSMELHQYDDRIWYLDGASGLVCAVFLLIFGMKILTQLTCFYTKPQEDSVPIKNGK